MLSTRPTPSGSLVGELVGINPVILGAWSGGYPLSPRVSPCDPDGSLCGQPDPTRLPDDKPVSHATPPSGTQAEIVLTRNEA
jgi:hypothetical protein